MLNFDGRKSRQDAVALESAEGDLVHCENACYREIFHFLSFIFALTIKPVTRRFIKPHFTEINNCR